MNAIAKGRNLRISPLKLRKVVKVLREKSVEEAMAILKILPNKAARMAYKVIHSAKANFKNRFPEAGDKDLKIETIFVDQAAVLRRMMPRARGRADVLRKMSSHLTVIVGDQAAEQVEKIQAQTTVKPEQKTAPQAGTVKQKQKKTAPKAKSAGSGTADRPAKKPAKKSK